MRINTYKILNEEGKPTLVKEKGLNVMGVTTINTPLQVRDMLVEVFQADRQAEEYLWLIAFNTKGNVLGAFEVSHGTVNWTNANPREIFVRLCLCGAAGFVIAHNHPSGDPTPSKEDFQTTEKMKKAGDMMGIELLDHLIIGKNGFYSFKSNE